MFTKVHFTVNIYKSNCLQQFFPQTVEIFIMKIQSSSSTEVICFLEQVTEQIIMETKTPNSIDD
jgi:hypothetical protein